jgi:hypothetical protein
MIGMVERRSYPRVEVSHPILYYRDTRGRPHMGSTIDLSLGGIRIETLYGLASGDRLEIYVSIHPHVIKSGGQVVYVLGYDGEWLKAGIRFDYLAGHDRHYIGEYIECIMEKGDRCSP